jgi:two-component system, response regulator YesN
MSQRWFKRQVLSYLPLLFLIIFILLAVMFLSLVKQSKNDVVRANGVFAKHVEQVVDYNLKSVETQILNAALQNDKIKRYFYEDSLDDGYFNKYEISNELDKLKISNPLIDSIYLYRSEDNTILSENRHIALDQHADQAFIKARLNGRSVNRKWSDARKYRDMEYSDHTIHVVSLASNYPPPTGEMGLIVVNVKVSEIEQLVKGMTAASDISYAQLIGADGGYIFAPGAEEGSEVLHHIVSEYTGWEIRTGINDSSLYSFSSRLFYLMLGIAAALLILGTCWIIFTARNHYKPIQTIMNRITYFSSSNRNIFQNQSDQARDEFTFIEEAFQHLTDQVLEYEKDQEEGLTFKCRHKLRELTSGTLIWNRTEWMKEAGKLNIPFEFDHVSVAIAEVDHYPEFVRKYSTRDQYLFQFVINSVLKEIAEQHHVNIWAEWLEGHRMAILLLDRSDQRLAEENSALICAKMVKWVRANLDFSITIGVGSCISDTEQIYLIHSQALAALNFKFVKGSGQVISHLDVSEENQGEVYKLIPTIRSFAYAYRIGESRWKDDLTLFFQELISGMYTKSDVYYLINNIVHTLRREMMELPEEVHLLWKNEMVPEMERILHGMETVEETRQQLEAALANTAMNLTSYREKRKHHSLVQDVRKYIERHYANPDVSLKHLEDEFGISGKYVSFLFRDEFGDKFVDYLAKLRLEHAEKLLVETNKTVQDIAVQVGYTNPMTLIRGFKKHFGMTPGDYRKKN